MAIDEHVLDQAPAEVRDPEQSQPAVLLVDDCEEFWSDIRHMVGDRYAIHAVPDAEAARSYLQANVAEVILLAIEFDGIELGYDLLDFLQVHYPEIPVVMISRHVEPRHVVRAMKLGAVHYLAKMPSRVELDLTLRTALELSNSRIRIRASEYSLGGEINIVGHSQAISQVRKSIRRCAGSDRPVLIVGESGTGKELSARAIHGLGSNAVEPFTMVNCAAFEVQDLESELFGHEQGAFEGAMRRRVGRLQEALRGTIYLEEISEMPLQTQRKLREALSRRRFSPLGSRQVLPLRARVIAGTSRELVRELHERRFDQQLLWLLNVLPLRLSPLRERMEDIEPLAQHFIYRKSLEMKRSVPILEREALTLLQRQNWRGNARELAGVIENALVHCEEVTLGCEHFKLIPTEEYGGLSYKDAKTLAEERFQRAYVVPVLRATRGSIVEAARLMQLPRQTLFRIMRKLDLRKEQFRDAPRQPEPKNRRGDDPERPTTRGRGAGG